MFNYFKHFTIQIILLISILIILYIFITNKQLMNEKIINYVQYEKSTNLQYKLIIPETCKSICKDISKISKSQLNHSLLSNENNLKLWPNFNANLTTLYNITYLHLLGGSWIYLKDNNNNNTNNNNNNGTSQIIIDNYCDNITHSGIAIIIPHKNQLKQLYITLSTLIPLLQRQYLCYRIFVIEQIDNYAFNKGKLMNIGFIEALKLFQFQCIIFHDVNLAPINNYIPYECDILTKNTMIHLSVAINTNHFKLPYTSYIDGVIKISTQNFITLNGFTNFYWGSNIQYANDFIKRLKAVNIPYVHIDDKIGRYIYISNSQQYNTPFHNNNNNNDHMTINEASENRRHYDGLNSLAYHVVSRINKPFFTQISVVIGQNPMF
ncbi:unnamed protein product [Heterobilharzia americana]|nr:unnamed protein product [Heterobilharzia americana]